MRPHSFRLKIALLSALLSGVVLVVFGSAFLALTYRVGLERVDRELKALGDSQLRSQRPWEMGQEFERSLRMVYGAENPERLIYMALRRNGDELFTSPHWPTGLTREMLPLPEPSEPDTPPPGRPGHRPPPPRDRPPRLGPGPEGPGPGPRAPHLQPPRLLTVEQADTSWRLAVMSHDHATIVLGMDLAAFYAENHRLRTAFFVALPIALLLLGGAGWFLASRALRPVTRIVQTARQVTARGLDQRIPELRSDEEFTTLIAVFNEMLERLERSFQQAARFSADAAHELKTPLTILQGELEQALQDAPDQSEAQRRYGELLEEVQRLRSIVRKLLLLSQADAGHMRVHAAPVNLSRALEAVFEDMQLLAPQLELHAHIEPNVHVQADGDLLNQVLHNLAGNAIKYCEAGGAVAFGLSTAHGLACGRFSNTAEPLSDKERKRVFERFYRGDPARNRKVDGVGLGLSLAREIVHSHQGELTVDNAPPGKVTFTMTLPLAPQGGTP